MKSGAKPSGSGIDHAIDFRRGHGPDVSGEAHRHPAGQQRRERQGLDLHEHGAQAYPEFVSGGWVRVSVTRWARPTPRLLVVGNEKPVLRLVRILLMSFDPTRNEVYYPDLTLPR